LRLLPPERPMKQRSRRGRTRSSTPATRARVHAHP
jgi:hypothetical protein